MSGTGGKTVDEFDVVGYLETKGYYGKKAAGGREMVYPCFMDCGEPATSTKRKLSVSVDDGFWHCWVCEAKGGSYLLQKFFGDEPDPRSNDAPYVSRLILDEATELGAQWLTANDELLMYLINERGLDEDTILERKLGYVGSRWSLVQNLPNRHDVEDLARSGLVRTDEERKGADWFYSHILIPYINRGHTVHMRGRLWGASKGARYLSGNSQMSRLYNLDSLDEAEECIVVEGEFDAMVVAQALARGSERVKKIGVVGLPGLQAIPEEFWDAMKDMKRVFVGFDSDEAGQKAAVKMKETLGAKGRILSLPGEDDEHGCDWTDFLLPVPADANEAWHAAHPYAGHDWTNISALMSAASGRRIVSIAEAGVHWRKSRQELDYLKTGFRQFDDTIAPGLLPGQVMIPLAKSGTGKTVYLCNLAFNMRERPVLYLSLEMTSAEIYERLRRIYHFWYPLASDHEVHAGLKNVYICDENRLREQDISSLAAEYEMETGVRPRAVFVDYLGYYARGFGGNSQYEKVGNAVMQLKADSKAGDFTTIAPGQVNRGAKEGKPLEMDDARDAGTIEETADFLLSLFRPDDALQQDVGEENNVQKTGALFADLLKSRHGGKGTRFKMQMDFASLAIVDAGSKAATRAREHNYKIWRGYTYDDIRRQELAPVSVELPWKDN